MEDQTLFSWNTEEDQEILMPLDLCMRIIGLEEKPKNLADQNLFRKVITDQVRRYGLYEVKKSRARLLEDWLQLQSLF